MERDSKDSAQHSRNQNALRRNVAAKISMTVKTTTKNTKSTKNLIGVTTKLHFREDEKHENCGGRLVCLNSELSMLLGHPEKISRMKN